MLPKHHAFVTYASPSNVKEFSSYIAKELGVTAAHNPDFHIRDYSRGEDDESISFGVDEASELTHFAGQRSTNGKKVFIIAANTITREGQNALLKTLEEPTEETVFAFLVPKGALIETVRSRTMELPWKPRNGEHEYAKEFLNAGSEKRSALIASLLKDKDKEGVRDLLDALERELLPSIKKESVQKGLSEIAKMRSYTMDRSPSLKMIMEHLSIVLPQK